MAAAITTNSTTLENQALEVIEALVSKQSVTATNPDGITSVTTYTRNMTTGVVTVTMAIPTDAVIDATDGSIDVTATPIYS